MARLFFRHKLSSVCRLPSPALPRKLFRLVSDALWSLVIVGILSLFGCGSQLSSSSGSSTGPEVAIAKVTDLGPVPTNPDIHGRDEAYSTSFQGYSVWLYGDTFLGNPDASGRTLLSNTWSYTTSFDASHGITGFQERLDSAGSPSMLIQETPDEASYNSAHNPNNCTAQPCGARWAIWPSSIVTDAVTNNALVFYTVQSVDPNGNFQGVGSSVAIWTDFNQLPVRPNFSPAIVAGHPDLMFSQFEPTFGSAAVIANGTLYIYGCGNDTNGLDKGCRIAKVNPATVQNRTTWTFYAGNGLWSSSVNDAVPVFDGLDILSVSWNSYLGRYVAVYAALLSNNVMVRTSPNPEGPWSNEAKVFTAMPPADASNIYDAQAHPEYDSNGGQTIYITYSRSTGSFISEVRLVAVQLQSARH